MAKRSSGTGRTKDSLRQRRRRQTRTAVALATPRWQRDFWLVQEAPVKLVDAGNRWIGLGEAMSPAGSMPLLPNFFGVDPWQNRCESPWQSAWDGLLEAACDDCLEEACDGPWSVSRDFG